MVKFPFWTFGWLVVFYGIVTFQRLKPKNPRFRKNAVIRDVVISWRYGWLCKTAKCVDFANSISTLHSYLMSHPVYIYIYIYQTYLSCDNYGIKIATVKIRLSLCRNSIQTTKTAHSDWSLLNNTDISNEYTIILRNKFNLFWRYPKHLHRMINRWISSTPTSKQFQNAYQKIK